MDIKIGQPLDISFETIGFEDKYGSVEFKITIITSGFDYHQSMSLNTWFSYYDIDEFIKNLRENNESKLTNLGGDFNLTVDSSENYIEWSHVEHRYSENTFSTFKARRELNDFYPNIVEAFKDYPRWWSK
ncbi:hypothetical protein [Providencia sp. Me31A]|uniref:hypothetical protein n=1 Tax=Providencia sp. Me31A TaxID=3392637 RepID=UPI003D2B6CB7